MRFLTIIAVVAMLLVFTIVASAHPASGIVVDSKGVIYFSDLETVWRVDTSGELAVFRPGERGRHVHELTIDKDDNIYGADISYVAEKWVSTVWRMTPHGHFSYLLQPTPDPPRGMSMWLDADGNMYWVDQNNHTKTRTLLLRRAPNGTVSTLAGSSYGHADGVGTEARFGSIGGQTFGPDGSIYLTDGDSVRKVTMDGTVTTIARGLTARTTEDSPTLFGGKSGSLMGLAVGTDGAVFVADSGNRRVLKISQSKVDVVLRSEPPFSPTGVAVTSTGDAYILEVGLTIPNVSSGPRVRKLSPDGTVSMAAMVGQDRSQRSVTAAAVEQASVVTESALQFVWEGRATKYVVIALLMTSAFVILRQRKRV